MLYTELTQRALKICFEAHRPQRDKGGMPYVFHPFHLAEQMETEEETCAALLHDVVEDTEWTMEELEAEGFPEPVLEALRFLTHQDSTPYEDYVRRLSSHPIAAKVKLADLRHNSTAGRLKVLREKDCGRLRKYLRSQAILTGGDADEENMELTISCRIPPVNGGEGAADALLRSVLAPDGTAKRYRVELPQVPREEKIFTEKTDLLRFLEQNGYSAACACSYL